MEYINDVNINEAVIHVLDSNGEEPVLNEFKLELDDEKYRFLFKHIVKCLNDDELRYAKFNQGRSIVKEICKDYLNGIENDIIGLSKDLARQLFAIQKGNVNIPSSDLVIASIITDQGPMIAILKMDYVRNFTHEIEIIESEVGVKLVPQVAGLPGSSQKIQKAAFIKPIREKDAFDLMILDKVKTRKGEDEYGTNYWGKNFLGCSVVINSRDNTKDFIRGAEEFVRRTYLQEPIKAEFVRSRLKQILSHGDKIDVEEIANSIIREPGEKETFKVILAGRCEESFEIDKTYAEKKLRIIKLKIGNDIQLIIDKDAYEDKSKFEIQHNADGSINMLLKNIVGYIEKE